MTLVHPAQDPAAPPLFLGRRFDAQARPLKDSGSTVIGHVRGPENDALAAVPALMKARGLARFWAWLPASSYHMTMFSLLLHAEREAERWPEGLARDVSDAEADAWVLSRLDGFETGAEPPFRMANRGIVASDAGLGVALEGETPEEDARLRALRDRLAARTGLAHRPGHESYGFHITLAYLIAWPSAEEMRAAEAAVAEASAALCAAVPVFHLGAPEVCLFHDMTEFRPRFVLA